MQQQITYSTFANCLDTRPDQHLTTWPDFVCRLAAERAPRGADDRTKKHATPLISPAAYDLGARRRDANVIGWGGWMGLDVDNDGPLCTPFEAAAVEALGLDAVIYTTTKATPDRHRYRVLLRLARDLDPGEIKPRHAAVCRMFEALAPDPACKDISRIYTVPSIWTPSAAGNAEPVNLFWARTDGVPLDIDTVLADHPPAVVAAPSPPPSVPPPRTGPIARPLAGTAATARPSAPRPLPPGRSILASPVVTAEMIEAYVAGPRGSHHVGLYRFMTRVAARAAAMGFALTVQDLVDFARAVDALSPIRTSAERWSRIHAEAERALAYAGPR